MTGRLIVVSNRIPTGANPSGGLVVALHDALSDRGGIWVGAHPDHDDMAPPGLTEVGHTPYTRLAFRLSASEYENYYLGFSNSVLWPLCHQRRDLVRIEHEFEASYRSVNERIADEISRLLRPDDVVWVHDYHLFPLASFLRKRNVSNTLGFFLHIPFPALGDLAVLPEPEDFAAWLAAYDLVGLQTRADTARCLEMFRADPRAELMHNGSIKFGNREFAVRSFPIGIDVEAFRDAAEADPGNLFGSEPPGEFIIGVDRLDYTKGLPNRFRAFGRYLENRADRNRRPCLVQIAPPSREEVHAYRQITVELEEIAGQLNGKHADLDWTPIRYIHRSFGRNQLAQLFRMARAGLVTSLADGMNLVAKEYVAAQDPEDPGVLILSRLAGAAEELDEALLINPYDIDEIAVAIDRALTMPLDERRARHTACLRAVQANDVAHWRQSFLGALEKVPQTPVKFTELLRARHVPDAAGTVSDLDLDLGKG